MSWRQAETSSAQTKMNAERAEFAERKPTDVFSAVSAISAFCIFSVGNGCYLPRTERLEKSSRPFEIELRIARFDAQEEPVSAGEGEPCHVEDRMVRLRQAVQCQHAEHR